MVKTNSDFDPIIAQDIFIIILLRNNHKKNQCCDTASQMRQITSIMLNLTFNFKSKGIYLNNYNGVVKMI